MPRGRYDANPTLKYGEATGLVLGFIGRNEDCTVAEIAQHLGMGTDTVKKTLTRLRDQGKVNGVKLDGVKFIRFRLGVDCGYAKERTTSQGQPHQRRVSDWKPCVVRDPLIDLFFGRNV